MHAFGTSNVTQFSCDSGGVVGRFFEPYMEEHNARLAALREHLAEGEAQARRGEFVENYSLQGLLAEMDREG
ncbi:MULTISPECIES: type II toxin-antitoxin system ParD family antitoxin [unclassified Thiocapsa]|uniref:type II toxin-antitoxin system ParD family antitoxin n=1 Tax=unclassified Thiocapsa TaxID=2641286 RepID=UPI0035ADAE92